MAGIQKTVPDYCHLIRSNPRDGAFVAESFEGLEACDSENLAEAAGANEIENEPVAGSRQSAGAILVNAVRIHGRSLSRLSPAKHRLYAGDSYNTEVQFFISDCPDAIEKGEAAEWAERAYSFRFQVF
jgi:hypothetical protein